MKKIIVVGGVAGGASFAARMRRLDERAEIVILDKGDYVSFANCGLPYYIGATIKDRGDLIIQTPERFKRRFNIDVRVKSEATSVDTGRKTVAVRNEGRSYEERYDYLVLSPGCSPVRPPIKGIDSPRVHTLRTIPDTDMIRAIVDGGKAHRALVIGGGFIGLEMAENLRQRGLEVALVELSDQVFAPADREMAATLHQHLQLNGVALSLGHGVKEILDDGGEFATVVLDNGTRIPAELIILAIGVKPDTAFLKNSGIALSDRGAIVVNEHLQTNIAEVYAVGDAVEVEDFVTGKKTLVPLAGPANRQGRIAADNIAGVDASGKAIAAVYKKTQGTAICKVFDLTVAVTGINEKIAGRLQIPFVKSYTHSTSHASYYPGAFPLSIKILFSPENGRLLGAQVIGKDGVDKRIDLFAVALRHGFTVDDLAELELAYAPPFGSAKDPVNVAGFVGRNIIEKKMDVFYAEDIAGIDRTKAVLLDVRTAGEHEQGSIPGSLLIPIDELRNRLGELDKSKEIFVYCQVGLRGYLATRILTASGFTARNLSGGYKTWSAAATLDYDGSFLKAVAEPSCTTPATSGAGSKPAIIVDACGLQCPGPIAKLKKAVDGAKEGDAIEIRATDQGFAADIPAWCTRTSNTLVSLAQAGGVYSAVVRKGAPSDRCTVPSNGVDKKTMVVFSNDLDKMLAAFIIANGAASMGSEVTLFFTFWGLNLLRKDRRIPVRKSIVERMFGMMMPRGSLHTKLSKMHMAGMGTKMMRMVMKKKNAYSLEELMEQARANGIRFVACTMSMDIMGIKKEELIDGIEYGGVAAYLQKADEAGYNLFI
jgi:NADPH-dependent 2,4-dienoyl-CoA reductase/sulfur reductase-like enzyme/peroxiredoxin family protein/rhodanese-related sulfurtransferase/TusA-related sulfurtransferase